MSNFFRGKPQPELSKVARAIPMLAKALSHPDDEIVMDSCWALSYLSDGTNDRVEAVVQVGLRGRLKANSRFLAGLLARSLT